MTKVKLQEEIETLKKLVAVSNTKISDQESKIYRLGKDKEDLEKDNKLLFQRNNDAIKLINDFEYLFGINQANDKSYVNVDGEYYYKTRPDERVKSTQTAPHEKIFTRIKQALGVY